MTLYKRPLRRLLALVLVITTLLAMAGAMPVSAASVKDQQAALQEKLDKLEEKGKEIEKNLSSASKDLQASEYRKNLIDSQIDNVRDQINLLQDKMDNLNSQIAAKQAAIKKAEQDINDKEKAIQATHDTLGQRLRAIAKSGNLTALQRLLNTENYTEYLLKAKAAEVIASHDQAAIDKLEAALKDIETKKEKLQKDKKTLESSKKQIAATKATSDSKKRQLDSLYAAARSEVNKLAGSVSSYKQQLKDNEKAMEAASAAIEALINNTGSTGKYNDGWMYWPVPTVRAVSSHYGQRWGRLHGGLDIANGSVPIYGQNIVAAASGTVISAQWNSSYGYYVLIDHGRNSKGQIVSTLYAHCSRLKVRVGQQVTGGKTVVGLAGATGNVTGPHLHFEVRLNGARVNPWSYVRPNIN